ncbi:CD209 antigen-like protein E isoform X1 [Eleginops maclovinus]|uniref:CD209 antigen-like protein E isoform X1 n=1 Tax=Eleginops maclovinus TaxID=56733 RepID=UPI00307FD627
MEETVKHLTPRSSSKPEGPWSSERFPRAAVLGLKLLNVFVLAVVIGLTVYCHYLIAGLADLSSVKANLTERLQACDQQLSSVSEERDRLKASLTEKTKEVDRLQRLSNQKKTCPAGWMILNSSCYLLSKVVGPWENGKQDCRERGADLVVIDSAAEQIFMAGFTKTYVWIGLSDREEEGTWKWVDGSPLNVTNWDNNQPDNGAGYYGEEDCAHISSYTNSWNDLSCNTSLPWICEKEAMKNL